MKRDHSLDGYDLADFPNSEETIQIDEFIEAGDASCGSIKCSRCGNSGVYMVKCKNCSCQQVKFLANPSQMDIINNPESVKTSRWFHATHLRNWHEVVTSANAAVHVGSLLTVQEVIRDLLFPNQEVYLWELIIKDTAKIAPWVTLDLDAAWVRNSDDLALKIGTETVLRYLNFYESSGEVSLLLNPQQLIPSNVTKYDGDILPEIVPFCLQSVS